MKLTLALLAATLSLASAAAQSAVVTYAFTTTLGDGVFSYDDSNVVQRPRPPSVSSGAAYYSALSFRFAGVDFSDPVIAVFNNFVGALDAFDVHSDWATAGTFAGTSLSLASSDLTVLGSAALIAGNGMELSSFDLDRDIRVGRVLGGVTSLTRVPEPGSLALVALAIGALGLSTRRPRRALGAALRTAP